MTHHFARLLATAGAGLLIAAGASAETTPPNIQGNTSPGTSAPQAQVGNNGDLNSGNPYAQRRAMRQSRSDAVTGESNAVNRSPDATTRDGGNANTYNSDSTKPAR